MLSQCFQMQMLHKTRWKERAHDGTMQGEWSLHVTGICVTQRGVGGRLQR